MGESRAYEPGLPLEGFREEGRHEQARDFLSFWRSVQLAGHCGGRCLGTGPHTGPLSWAQRAHSPLEEERPALGCSTTNSGPHRSGPLL